VWIKRVLITIAALIALAVAGVVAFVVINPDSTECYGIFESADSAAAAVHASDDAGFDETIIDERGHRTAVTFVTRESGDDAAETRERFATFLTEHNGIRGHPGDGCLGVEALGR
jgi:hypothetical protein